MILSIVVGALTVSSANPERQFPQPQPSPQQLQLARYSMLPFYLENSEQINNYYAQHTPDKTHKDAPPSRLETLEPDSEVELLPGAQPQQPPQQNPVAPNLPGLIPGQRVFIVHMPVPGYRPGTVGGYQPVYVVAAAPNGHSNNNNYVPTGYQNPVIDPSTGQVLLSPFIGYPQLRQQNVNPGYLVVAPAQISAVPQRSFDHPYHPGPNHAMGVNLVPNPTNSEGAAQALRLSQLIGLYPPPGHVVANLQNQEKVRSQGIGDYSVGSGRAGLDNSDANARASRLMHAADSIEIKESSEDSRQSSKQNKQ